MENLISFVIINIILDAMCLITLKKLHRLAVTRFELFIILVFGLMPSLAYVFLQFEFALFVLFKAVYLLLASLLMTDLYKFKPVMFIYFSSVIIELSCFGFARFMSLFVGVIINETLGKTLGALLDAVVLLCVFVYLYLVYAWFNKLAYKKTLKTFLSKVSFTFCGKHIELTGLLDSGNYLYDQKLGKYVIVVEVRALKRFLSKEEYYLLENGGYNHFGRSHLLQYNSSSEERASMPVFDIGNVKIDYGGEIKNFDCAMGLASQRLSSTNDFECLVCREFM